MSNGTATPARPGAGAKISQTTARDHGTSNANDMSASPTKSKPATVSYMRLAHKGQLAILCIARLTDPLATTSIQSYMFYQLKFFDPSASDSIISSQAGILIGAKTAAQVCTGLAYVGFGFSRSFGTAVAWQVFGGAMSSNVAIVRCVVAELYPDKRYRTRALLLLPLFANTGMLLGPLVGGLLSSPTEGGLLKRYPYAAPNMLVGTLYMLAALGVGFGLKETLEIHDKAAGSSAHRLWRKAKAYVQGKRNRDGHDYAIINSDEPVTPISPISPIFELSPTSDRGHDSAPLIPSPPKRKAKLPFRRMFTFNVICTMFAHFIIAGHLGTFSNLWAIFLSTPVDKQGDHHSAIQFTGGLGMLPRDVGFAMSLLGALGVLLQLVVYPPLNDRFGTIKVWRSALFIFPVVYLLAPYPSLVASTSGQKVHIWLAMSFVLLLFVAGRAGVTPATTLIINDCTPHPSVRATIHTIGTAVGNLGRSLFPVGALAIFGQGLRINVVGLGFWCLACLAIFACVASAWVREGSNGKEIVLDGDEEEEEEEEVEEATAESRATPAVR